MTNHLGVIDNKKPLHVQGQFFCYGFKGKNSSLRVFSTPIQKQVGGHFEGSELFVFFKLKIKFLVNGPYCYRRDPIPLIHCHSICVFLFLNQKIIRFRAILLKMKIKAFSVFLFIKNCLNIIGAIFSYSMCIQSAGCIVVENCRG